MGPSPGGEMASGGLPGDVPALAALLLETGMHHDPFEKSHEKHNWWDWYAAYMVARQRGESPDAASAAATRYLEDDLHVPHL